MTSQAYFEVDGVGDFYAATQVALPGESPTTAPDKWEKLEIPAIFETYLVEKAAALLLTGEGLSDKRRAHEGFAAEELEEIQYRHTERGEFERPEVMVR